MSVSLDTSLLRVLKYRERYEKLIKAVPLEAMDPKTRVLLDDFGVYFKEFPEQDKACTEAFITWFNGFRHAKLKAEDKSVWAHLLREVSKDATPDIQSGLLERLVSADCAARMTSMLEKYADGQEVDVYQSLKGLVDRFETQTDRQVRIPWVRINIDTLFDDDVNDAGLHWRWACLNKSMRPVRGGDFGVIAARPDRGKTSAIADNITHFSTQIDAFWPDQKRSILWLNNEGKGSNIIKRCMMAALNKDINEMVQLVKDHQEGRGKNLWHLYREVTGGRSDMINVLDVHDYKSHEIEAIVEESKPAVVVFDMIDNIGFSGDTLNNGERTDQLLEGMYQWGRKLAVKHDFVGLATSQISADGDGMPYPTLPMLKDSKTGKQGAADFIITIGASNDPGLTNARFIGCTKNKLARPGAPKDPRWEMHFDSARGRFIETEAA